MRAKHAVAISAAALLTVLSGPSRAQTVGTCHSPATYFVTDTNAGQTNSSSWVLIPDGALGIRTTTKGCIEVDFVASTYIYPTDAIEMEAWLDGNTVMGPGPFVVDDGDSQQGRTITTKWVVNNVPAGGHQIYLYWRTIAGATTAYMGNHTTTIEY